MNEITLPCSTFDTEIKSGADFSQIGIHTVSIYKEEQIVQGQISKNFVKMASKKSFLTLGTKLKLICRLESDRSRECSREELSLPKENGAADGFKERCYRKLLSELLSRGLIYRLGIKYIYVIS